MSPRLPTARPGHRFFAVVPPVSGIVDGPLARRLGRPEPSTQQLTVTAELAAQLVVNGPLAAGTEERGES
jgi:hypothetical protein